MIEEDEKIKRRLSEIVPKELLTNLVDISTGSKPAGWSRKSQAPYFKEIFGAGMKKDIDQMIETGKPMLYRYTTWCTEGTKMSPNTLYQRVNQSIRYVVERMDTPERKYGRWYERVVTTRPAGVGVLIQFVTGLGDTVGHGTFKAEQVEERESLPAWKVRMEDWLEGDDDSPFIQENLCLTPNEVASLKLQFATLTNVIASVKSSSVKIVRA